jgi:hypothetical protein
MPSSLTFLAYWLLLIPGIFATDGSEEPACQGYGTIRESVTNRR